MITIRNPNEARARTVVASEALEVGMIVRVIQGTAKGEPWQVRKAVVADLDDLGVKIGVVDFIPDSDLTIDYIIDPVTKALSLNTGDDNSYKIPSGSLCVIWTEKPIVGYLKPALSAEGQSEFATAREADLVTLVDASSKPGFYDAAGGTEDTSVIGMIYQHDGPEISIEFTF